MNELSRFLSSGNYLILPCLVTYYLLHLSWYCEQGSMLQNLHLVIVIGQQRQDLLLKCYW